MADSKRRNLLKHAGLFATASGFGIRASHAQDFYPKVVPRTLFFPRDYGAHPEFRTEWWYLTGIFGDSKNTYGFQITFFRSRTQHAAQNPSRFAPTQLLFAHAAISDVTQQKLFHADRAARSGSAGAGFSTHDTDLRLGDWRFARTQSGYVAQIEDSALTMQLAASTKESPVLRGAGGVSRKGPNPELASYYYSRPQLSVSAQIRIGEGGSDTAASTAKISKPRLLELSGKAWLDHEWSSSLLMQGASGWDWIGMNLHDGSTLMAFRIRSADGHVLWSEWDMRDAGGNRLPGSRATPQWTPKRTWRSPTSLIEYPIEWSIRAQSLSYDLLALMPNQEIDARASTGGFYWEGAMVLRANGAEIGRGYLELTGYGEPLRL